MQGQDSEYELMYKAALQRPTFGSAAYARGGKRGLARAHEAAAQPRTPCLPNLGKSWIRIPAIMYGVHAATTVLPMLAEFYYGPGTDSQKKVKEGGCVGPVALRTSQAG